MKRPKVMFTSEQGVESRRRSDDGPNLKPRLVGAPEARDLIRRHALSIAVAAGALRVDCGMDICCYDPPCDFHDDSGHNIEEECHTTGLSNGTCSRGTFSCVLSHGE